MAREVDYILSELFILVNKDPMGVKLNVSLVGVSETSMGRFYVFKGVYKGHEVEAVVGEKGDFRIIVDDGIAAPWLTCRDVMNRSSWVFSHFLGKEYSKPIFVGLSGDEAVVELPAYECDVATGECVRVKNATPVTSYRNPYELYKFEIDGIPIKPFIKIRCTDPAMHDGFTAVYFEGFLPRLYTHNYSVVSVDDRYVSRIVDILVRSGISVDNAGEVVVEDFYYSVGFNDTLEPTLLLRVESKLAAVQLYPEGPAVTALAQLAGSGGDIVGDSAVDWDEVLSSVEPLDSGEKRVWDMVVYVAPVAVVTAVIAYKLLARKE